MFALLSPRSNQLVDPLKQFFLRYQPVLLIVATALVVGEISVMHAWIAHHYVDLQVYRFGVQRWLHGGDMYGLLPKTDAGSSLPFIYPPFAAILLLPLAVVRWGLAAWGIDLLSFFSMAGTLYLAARKTWPTAEKRTALTLTMIGLVPAMWLEPVRENFSFGQVNLFLMGLIAADCLIDTPWWPRGFLIGVAAAVKLTPAAFILFFLLRRDFRAAVVSAISAVAITLATFLITPGESVRYWFGGLTSLAGVSGSPYFSNQTIRAVLARLNLPHPVQTGGWVLVAALVVLAAALIMWRVRTTAGLALALIVNAAAELLISPTSWSHHWVWVAPALLVLLLHTARTRHLGWLAATVSVATVFVIGPHHLNPAGDGRELHWTPLQHVIGDAYVELTLLLLAVGAAVAIAAWRRDRAAAAALSAGLGAPRADDVDTPVDEPASAR